MPNHRSHQSRSAPRTGREGRFREDLYFRLATFEMALPPLCGRGPIFRCWPKVFWPVPLARTAAVCRSSKILCDYPWPGNVRQLRNAVHHAALLARSGEIDVQHLPDEIQEGEALPINEPASADDLSTAVRDWTRRRLRTPDETVNLYEQFLHAVEPPLLEVVLERTRHNRAAAAEMLGIHRATLRKNSPRRTSTATSMATHSGATGTASATWSPKTLAEPAPPKRALTTTVTVRSALGWRVTPDGCGDVFVGGVVFGAYLRPTVLLTETPICAADTHRISASCTANRSRNLRHGGAPGDTVTITAGSAALQPRHLPPRAAQRATPGARPGPAPAPPQPNPPRGGSSRSPVDRRHRDQRQDDDDGADGAPAGRRGMPAEAVGNIGRPAISVSPDAGRGRCWSPRSRRSSWR